MSERRITSPRRAGRIVGLLGVLVGSLASVACSRAPGPSAESAREAFSREWFCPVSRVEAVTVLPMRRPPDVIARDPERLRMWLDAAHARATRTAEPRYRVSVKGCQEHVDYTCWERPTVERRSRHGERLVMTMASCVPDTLSPYDLDERDASRR